MGRLTNYLCEIINPIQREDHRLSVTKIWSENDKIIKRDKQEY